MIGGGIFINILSPRFGYINDVIRILGGKPIVRHDPYPEEADEPQFAQLPRLVLSFDMSSYGRLRQLIDALNEIG